MVLKFSPEIQGIIAEKYIQYYKSNISYYIGIMHFEIYHKLFDKGFLQLPI